MDEVAVPCFYVVSRKIPREEAFPIVHALSITPVWCAVIYDVLDAALAAELAPDVVITVSETQAFALAAELHAMSQRPILVVGEAEFLDAIYPDGKREAVATSC